MITTVDGIVNALGNSFSRTLIDKASIANAVAGQMHSLWRATGQPGQGAIPTTSVVCNNALVGALNFAQQTLPNTSYFAYANSVCTNSAVTVEIHDRLAHMGGLNATLLTSQTVNLDLNAYSSDNIVVRIGDADYSNIIWWLEVYANMGATASNATINVTYNDGTSGDLTVVAVGGTLRASRLIQLNGLIPVAKSGFYIRDINTVILSASTGTAGNFGFTATRQKITMPLNLANKFETFDWASLGLPIIPNGSCLSLLQLASTTSTGIVRGGGKIVHG